MNAHPARRWPTMACAALCLGSTVTGAAAATWVGGTGSQAWNLGANWDSNPDVPSAEGAVATFSPGADMTVVADAAAAAVITFGDLDLTVNRTLSLGNGLADQGSFVLDGAGAGDATIDLTGIASSLRGVALTGTKLHHFTLAGNVTVNCTGAGESRALFQVRGSAATTAWPALNGNGYTVTLNGGQLALGNSGFNQHPATNVVFDVRNAKYTNGGALPQVDAVSTGGNGYQAGYGLRIIIGTAAGQRYAVASSGTIGADLLLAGKTTIANSGGRTFSLTGRCADYAGTNLLSLVHTDTTARSVTISGTFTNTYAGGTFIDFYNSASGVGSHTLNLNKAGSLGTGDVDVNRLATLSFGAHYALGKDSKTSGNGVTFAAGCGLASLALGAYTQATEFTKVGANALAVGEYTAAQLETALEAAGLPATLAVTGTGKWIVVPPQPARGTAITVR